MDKVFAVFISSIFMIGWIWIFGQSNSVYVQAGMIVFSILGGCLMVSQADEEHDEDENGDDDIEMIL